MTATNQATLIAHLFKRGFMAHEICEMAKTSPIFTKHTISRLCMGNPYAESRHYANRRIRAHKVRIINNDPYFEEVNRFVL